MKRPDPIFKIPRIKVRMVWRLVLGLFFPLTLLLFLAIYLVLSLNSLRSYAPVAKAGEIQLESLNTLPALLGAMDAERRIWQKTGDPRNLALYAQTREAVENNLASLALPQLWASEKESQRRNLVRQWINEIGDVTTAHPPDLPNEADPLDARSSQLLDQFNAVSAQVRDEIQTTLADLQAQETSETNARVNFMWIGVGTVTAMTIVIQLLVSNSIIGPIETLSAAVRRLQSGDYTVRAHIRSGDEIESLGETFNTMAENILHHQRELEEKNDRLFAQQAALRNANLGLEERVAEKTRELEDKNQKLSAAARLKDEFLATLSHELRTPLTPVISCAHLLDTDPKLGPEQRRNVQAIDRNARALSRMIDELLDLSAVMNHKLRLLRERTDLNEWTRATLETLRPAWEKKEITLTFVPSEAPVELEIDSTRLAQVLTNLINNAIKFTDPKGHITVRLTSTDHEIRLVVTDSGVGLDRAEIERIFEMFHQSRNRSTEGVGGLGVGLTVARSLAELHGGGLRAESPGPGQGASFTLWLPRQPGTLPIVPPRVAAPLSAGDRVLLRGRRILLVEDSTDSREALLRIFQRRECLVRTAATGEEALELALREPPEIIISDIGLPGMSGLEFMGKLRIRPDFREVIAIALSGLGREQDIQAAALVGFDSHLLKPVDINVLDQTLVEALQKRFRQE